VTLVAFALCVTLMYDEGDAKQNIYCHYVSIQLGTSLLCFLNFQLFFPAILFKITYYSQNYTYIESPIILTIMLQVFLLFIVCMTILVRIL